MIKKENTIWVERYRPKTLDEYIGNDHIKTKVNQYITENDPPHLLFYGKAGTGKTTLAKIIANNTDCDEMYINASDETGIDMVRTRVKPFSACVSLSTFKLVILDEFDFVTPNSQAMLRNLMEQFSRTTRFILTCNYHEKIIDPIRSRCQVFEVFPPSRKQVAIHVANLLKKENVKFIPEDIKILIDHAYPDIRQIINSCQRNTIDRKLKVNKKEIIDSDFRLKLLEILKGKDKKDIFRTVRQLVADNHVSDFSGIYSFLYDKVDEIAPDNKANLILIIAQGVKDDVFVVDKEINFMSTIIEIINQK